MGSRDCREMRTLVAPGPQRRRGRWDGTIILLLLLGLVASCASLPPGRGKEPKVIAIRNRSGADIATVTLREASRSGSAAARFGSISPVPDGATQVVVRPSNPPALPRTIAVEWVDSDNRTRVKELSLSAALRSLAGSPNEALVFEFGPFHDVLVFVETVKQ